MIFINNKIKNRDNEMESRENRDYYFDRYTEIN